MQCVFFAHCFLFQASELQDIFNCKTIEATRKRRDEIIADYKDVAGEAMTCLDEGFEAAMTVMVLPGYLQRMQGILRNNTSPT